MGGGEPWASREIAPSGLQFRFPAAQCWPMGGQAESAQGTAGCAHSSRSPREKLRAQAPQTGQGLLPSHPPGAIPHKGAEGAGLTTQDRCSVLQGLTHSQHKTCVGRRERDKSQLSSTRLSGFEGRILSGKVETG